MKKLILFLTLCSFSLSSCCTVTRSSEQAITIASNPPNARITIDGYDCGTTPQIIAVDLKHTHHVLIEKEGFQSKSYTFKSRVSPLKLSSNVLFPIGLGLVGTGTALVLMSGTTAGLAAPFVIFGAIAGACVGGVVGAAGTGVDIYSGKGCEFTSNAIQANLEPMLIPPYKISQ